MTEVSLTPRALDGLALIDAIEAGTRAIERNRDVINALNVFPVPDGDTGTNMGLTLQKVVADARAAPSDEAGAVANLMARSALLAARGNSGLILAQFFKGLAGATNGHHEVDAGVFRKALRLAVDAAYKAVPDPKEGTMLTVFREAAEAAEAEDSSDLVTIWKAATERSLDAVRRTPDMLAVLKEAGVVDSGGFGFAALLSGGLARLTGESDGSIAIDVPGMDVPAGGIRISREFMDRAESEVWGYCVSFAIEGDALDPDAIRERAISIGKSTVVAGDERQVKVHLHSLDPGPAISYGAGLGTLSNVSILNMDEQQEEWSAARQRGPEKRGSSAAVAIAVVAVVIGDGWRKLYISNGLGACSVVEGGDSMNPSTADLLSAVEAAPSSNVILLPNNKNVVGTANLVPGLTSKNVAVVPTASMQAGVAALLAFSPDQPFESNLQAMKVASGGVRAGAVCLATRDSKVDGRNVMANQAMGLLDGKLVAVGDRIDEVATEMLTGSVSGAELLTIYTGAGVSRPDAERLAGAIRRRTGGLEIEIVDGDQPGYPYLFAIE